MSHTCSTVQGHQILCCTFLPVERQPESPVYEPGRGGGLGLQIPLREPSGTPWKLPLMFGFVQPEEEKAARGPNKCL